MTSPAAQKLIAIVECLAPMLDDLRVEVAIAYLLQLAAQVRASNEEDLEGARADREISGRVARQLNRADLARRTREPA